MDLNHGPSGYEPDELPDCSTPRYLSLSKLAYKLEDWQAIAKRLIKLYQNVRFFGGAL